MPRQVLLFIVFILFACSIPRASIAVEPLKPAELPKLITAIKPKKDESKWLTIPWETSLWTARQRAAAEGKPILLWEMDGHPMGCT